ncbi:MAG: lysostaphin resistance A-like protein [Deltaproteobacteria bacterium]
MSDAAAQPSDDRFATALRGFGPVGILAFLAILAGNLVVLPLSAILVLLWARRSRTPWREIGYVRPRSWVRTLAIGTLSGVAFKLAMKALVMPLLGADPVNHAYHYLAGNTAALPGALYLVIVGAAFGEETVFRGYFFERLGKLLGSGAPAKAAMVLLTSTLFALAHYRDQGLAGTEQAAFTGLVFGTIFARTGSIWLPMVMHAAFDVIAVAIIYADAESAIAHFLFR